ncbi:hypothetical protein PCL_12490 [Purpureocillium lilacinum]|uniref:Uncharacterized protein n=1 Tax=Purpureocillium lilacinum TaxID=33203 RepID=A0A2U3E9F8_PURLI|nr:hypothetical protein PCL_12490 [Purpureocillium lilacinum]
MVCPEFATDDAAHGGSAGPSFWASSTAKARHHGVSALPAIISHRTDRLVGEEASLAKALGRWRSATGASRGDRQNRNLQHPLALASRRERLGGTTGSLALGKHGILGAGESAARTGLGRCVLAVQLAALAERASVILSAGEPWSNMSLNAKPSR